MPFPFFLFRGFLGVFEVGLYFRCRNLEIVVINIVEIKILETSILPFQE